MKNLIKGMKVKMKFKDKPKRVTDIPQRKVDPKTLAKALWSGLVDICDFCDSNSLTICVKRGPAFVKDIKWFAYIEGSETDAGLGRGPNPPVSVMNLLRLIAGRTVRINKKKVKFPINLTFTEL